MFEEQLIIRVNMALDRLTLAIIDILDPAKPKTAQDLMAISIALATACEAREYAISDAREWR